MILIVNATAKITLLATKKRLVTKQQFPIIKEFKAILFIFLVSILFSEIQRFIAFLYKLYIFIANYTSLQR